MMTRRHALFIGTSLLVLVLLRIEPVPAEKFVSPAWMELRPYAVQNPEWPMIVTIGGLDEDETVRLRILRTERAENAHSLTDWTSQRANFRGLVTETVDFSALATQGVELPRETTLWLRVIREGARRTTQSPFGIVENPCTVWRSLVDKFFRGRCNPKLAQALHQHRDPSDLTDTDFEVRWLSTPASSDAGTPPHSVPATRGATGVAWQDQSNLLVTIAPTKDRKPEDLPAGLYRVPLEDSPVLLWRAEDSLRAVAPFLLSRNKIVFARQSLATPRENEPIVSYIHVLEDGELQDGIPIENYRTHQILAYEEASNTVLVLSLGGSQGRPGFLTVDLHSGEVRHQGYHHGLYHAAMRSPRDDVSVIAAEDSSSGDESLGWFLALVDGDGRPMGGLQTRSEHDLLPSWSPNGGKIAYLAEIDRPSPDKTSIVENP